METKYAQLQKGARMPFVDPRGYRRYVADRRSAYRTELAKQQSRPLKSTHTR
jgi:hypothetical protein